MHCKYLNVQFSIDICLVSFPRFSKPEIEMYSFQDESQYYNSHLIKQMDVKGYLFTHDFV